MRPARLHTPVGNEHDRVRAIEHERARRHDDRRAARPEVVELAGDARLGMRVDGARRLDEDEDLGAREQSPHEHESLPLPTRERPAALVDDLVEAGRERDEHILRSRNLDRSRDLVVARSPPWVELAAERAGEDERVGLADEDPATHELEGQPVERRVPEHHAAVVDEAAEPIGERARLVRVGGDEAGQAAGLDREPGVGIDQRDTYRRLRQRLAGVLDRPLDREDAQHLAGADVRTRELLDRLCRRPQRDDEEPGVPVEGDQLPGGDVARGGEMRADPGDEDDEEPRQEHLGRVERRLRRCHAHAATRTLSERCW